MNAAYIRHSLNAALRIARFDPDAMSEFDTSYDGFFRSFGAMFVCLPLYVVILLGERRIELAGAALARGIPTPTFNFYAIEGTAYIVDWLALPLMMLAVSPLIGTNGRYVPFVVAYNWGTCIVFAVQIVPYILYLGGIVPASAFLFFYGVAMIFSLVYRWRIARDGLQVSGLTASGVVILDVLLGLLLTLLAARLRGG